MYKKTLSLLVSISIVFTPMTAYSQDVEPEPSSVEAVLDLRVTAIKEGEVAPFGGVLLTTDSLTKMQAEFERKIAEMEVSAKYSNERYMLHLQTLNDRLTQESLFRRNEVELRESYIEELEEKYLEKDNLSPWMMAGTFILGCLTTIAIAYSLEGAYK